MIISANEYIIWFYALKSGKDTLYSHYEQSYLIWEQLIKITKRGFLPIELVDSWDLFTRIGTNYLICAMNNNFSVFHYAESFSDPLNLGQDQWICLYLIKAFL